MTEDGVIKDYSAMERFWLLHAENELRGHFPQISRNLGISSIPLHLDLTLKPGRPGKIPKNIILGQGNASRYAGAIFDRVLKRFELGSKNSVPVKIPVQYIQKMGSSEDLEKYKKFLLDSLLTMEMSVLFETVETLKHKLEDGGILGLGMGQIHEYLKGYDNWLRRIGWYDIKPEDKHSGDLTRLWEDSYNKAIGRYSVEIVYKNHPVVGGTYKSKLSSKKLLEQLCDENGGSVVESIEALRVGMETSGKEKTPSILFPSFRNGEAKNDLTLLAFPFLPASSITLDEYLRGDN